MNPAEKEQLRELVRAERRALTPAFVAEASAAIAARVLALPELAAARLVAAYCARPHEVQTRAILEACWAAGRAVCVPASDGAGGYRFRRLAPGAPLQAGPLRVPEPAATAAAAWVAPGEPDVVLVPGVAFDRAGGRLGHGGGHYDRLLADCRGRHIGLAFAMQVVPRVPRAPHDRAVELVVTEKEVIVAADDLAK